jgi:hypothetical protein
VVMEHGIAKSVQPLSACEPSGRNDHRQEAGLEFLGLLNEQVIDRSRTFSNPIAQRDGGLPMITNFMLKLLRFVGMNEGVRVAFPAAARSSSSPCWLRSSAQRLIPRVFTDLKQIFPSGVEKDSQTDLPLGLGAVNGPPRKQGGQPSNLQSVELVLERCGSSASGQGSFSSLVEPLGDFTRKTPDLQPDQERGFLAAP